VLAKGARQWPVCGQLLDFSVDFVGRKVVDFAASANLQLSGSSERERDCVRVSKSASVTWLAKLGGRKSIARPTNWTQMMIDERRAVECVRWGNNAANNRPPSFIIDSN